MKKICVAYIKNDNNLDVATNFIKLILTRTNSFLKITAEVFPIDEYRTSVKCIENKNRTKNGIYRKSRKLMDSNMKWLVYMLEEYGFIRKPKTIS